MVIGRWESVDTLGEFSHGSLWRILSTLGIRLTGP